MSFVPRELAPGQSRLRPQVPTPRVLLDALRLVYADARRDGEERRVAASFAALSCVQRVSYFVGWQAAARRHAAAERNAIAAPRDP